MNWHSDILEKGFIFLILNNGDGLSQRKVQSYKWNKIKPQLKEQKFLYKTYALPKMFTELFIVVNNNKPIKKSGVK